MSSRFRNQALELQTEMQAYNETIASPAAGTPPPTHTHTVIDKV